MNSWIKTGLPNISILTETKCLTPNIIKNMEKITEKGETKKL